MFTGDNVLGHGTAAVEHLSTWMAALRKMQTYNCVRGYPAHGAVISNLQAKIGTELSQKIRREQQVLQNLEHSKSKERASGGRGKGSVTVKEIVTAVYGNKIDDGLREMALEPFIDEVLRKLSEDGLVAFEMRAGVKKWFSFQ